MPVADPAAHPRSSRSSREHRRSRTRSRSPSRRLAQHHRARSPSHRHHRHGSSHRSRRSSSSPRPSSLPLDSRPLSKHDFDNFKPLFGLYLDIQKQLDVDKLDDREVKGRWKRFVSRWNHGELAEGWYDPATLQKAIRSTREARPDRGSPAYGRHAEPLPRERDGKGRAAQGGEDEDEDDFGPALPPPARPASGHAGGGPRAGPAIPRQQDLEHRDELLAEDRDADASSLRAARAADRHLQKQRLEELVPRADPGTRERALEKKADTAATHRAFRDAKSPGAEEIREAELMGDDDGVEGYKARKREEERKKNEREIRREELLRARAVEREERLAAHREKEDRTMEMLRALARQRFG